MESAGQYTTMGSVAPVNGYRERKKKGERGTKKKMFVGNVLMASSLTYKRREEERKGENKRVEVIT